MKVEIKRQKAKCLKKLLEKSVKFKSKDCYVTCDFNCGLKRVWLTVYDEFTNDSVISFKFYYDNLRLKQIENLTNKIINVLDEIEKETDVEDICAKLPFASRYSTFVDIYKFMRR